tara:strand:+ start:6185 stop:6553 length:369 start_codon:yes stop_codon:yes gene_type:complete
MAFTATPADARYTYQMFKDTDVDENTKIDVTGAPGTLYYLDCVSTDSGSSRFVKFYDAAVVTRGTTRPILVIKIAAQGSTRMSFPDGIPFATAISYCCDDGAGTAAGSGPAVNKMTIRFVVS